MQRVVLSREVAWACLSHALTTEHQEIMGLLLGYQYQSQLFITRSLVLSRKDRQKDRVEVGDELLASSSAVAEALSEIDGHNETIVGWYHSHPHITVMPSHVDVKTQGIYQQLDSSFIGLIFSVFDGGRFDVCAFQSKLVNGNDWTRIEVPLVFSYGLSKPLKIESVVSCQLGVLNEESEIASSFMARAGLSQLRKCRVSALHKCSLFRLMDQQLLPTLLALRSKRLSLELRLRKLRKEEEERGPDACERTAADAPPATSAAVDQQLAVLRAMESLTPVWTRKSHCLDCVFSGLFVQVLRSDVRDFQSGCGWDESRVLELRVSALSPRPSLSIGSAPAPRCSPWALTLRPHLQSAQEDSSWCRSFSLLAVGPVAATQEEGRELVLFSVCDCHLCLESSNREQFSSTATHSSSCSVKSLGIRLMARDRQPSRLQSKFGTMDSSAEDVTALLRNHLHIALQLNHFHS